MKKQVYVNIFLETGLRVDPRITLIAGESGLSKEIKISEMNRPGLALAGFYDFFAYDRIQIFGLGEAAYMKQLPPEQKRNVYEKFFSYDILCCIFTHSERPDELFCKMADENGVSVFVTERKTTNFVGLLTHLLYNLFAPAISVHATLVEVFGIGIMLMGKSGVGKSECALELLERGHKLVADDVVEIKKVDEVLLVGNRTDILKHYMEIRGLGIINVQDIFGIRSVRNKKRIELVASLEEWDDTKEYERLGLDENTYPILDIKLPLITVPVRPGRNIPVIIEAAALNQHLKKLGINSAQQLDERLKNLMEKKNG
ncbi:MAG: HPr(Ser) kinase/phosphatase [Spirochaetia bacterium]|jgi:HPr kinase/phosphorylase|nr:HPr(Ser) kinase/phosphatase [Spirochaetia bacterium]